MVESSMFKAAAVVIQHYFGPVAIWDEDSQSGICWTTVVRPSGMVAEHGPKLGNVAGKKCPLVTPT